MIFSFFLLVITLLIFSTDDLTSRSVPFVLYLSFDSFDEMKGIYRCWDFLSYLFDGTFDVYSSLGIDFQLGGGWGKKPKLLYDLLFLAGDEG